VAAFGGPAIQVTRKGGSFAMESPDGKWLYFTVIGGTLRRMPVGGGEETDYAHDLGIPTALDVSPFFVSRSGLYYLGMSADGRSAFVRFIGHFGGKSRIVGRIPRTPSAGLSISSDKRFLLYSQYDQSSAEILVVDKFH
jgi:hypothetical protein